MRVNSVSTKDNLGHRGVQLTSGLCVLCVHVEESIENLFFECKISNHDWNLCKWAGLTFVIHKKTPSNICINFACVTSIAKVIIYI